MTDSQPTIAHGDEYLVIYSGGPNDGNTDTRIATDDSVDQEITVITAVDGKETLIDYTYESFVEVGGQAHVTYVFDPKDSEPVDDPEDRGDRQ
ncbi:MAG: oligoribonuclease [Microbacteriaceae bacterium]|jgi:hypothetical protein|nr:oligoribonuclease [Microbacteriaceae bacterium]